jgi:N-acyl-D-aspartate/D-glutamate deacylase
VGERSHDFVIRGASIIDGSGAAAWTGDVAVRGDRIVAVGEVREPAARSVEASGLALSPGFIDVHSHDDFAVLFEPEMSAKLLQGVTTDVVGNCGLGAAPHREAAVTAAAFTPGRMLAPYEGYAGYLAAIDRDPPSLNVAALVGHGTIRAAAMENPALESSEVERGRMRALLEEGLEAGAVGLSTGLIYEPGRNAREDEIIFLARALAGAGALYTSHMRDESLGLVDSVRETIRVGETAGVAVQISHHKAAGRAAWGMVRESLRQIDEARARGVDVAADQYPYTSASTILAAVVQNRWIEGASAAGAGRALGGDEVVIASSAKHPEWDGRSLAEIGAGTHESPFETARRVLAEDPAVWAILHMMSEDDVREVMRHPTTLIGSDGLPTGGKPHPRLCGTFARVLGRYVRDEHVLGLEDAVHRMTGASALRFGLEGRGFVRPGFFADLVLFDPKRIADRATPSDPRCPPDGIANVFVNGVEVVRDGHHTHARPGRALRRGR